MFTVDYFKMNWAIQMTRWRQILVYSIRRVITLCLNFVVQKMWRFPLEMLGESGYRSGLASPGLTRTQKESKMRTRKTSPTWVRVRNEDSKNEPDFSEWASPTFRTRFLSESESNRTRVRPSPSKTSPRVSQSPISKNESESGLGRTHLTSLVMSQIFFSF